MKKYLYILVLILAAVCAVFIFRRLPKTAKTQENVTNDLVQSTTETGNTSTTYNSERQVQQRTTSLKTTPPDNPPISEAVSEYVRKSMADPRELA